MSRVCAVLLVLALMPTVTADAADPRLADGVSGAPIAWTDWVAKRGPVAVLVWASWAPGADEALAGHPALDQACNEAGLKLVVLDVQESLEDGRAALEDHELAWIHDRHGALLKQYRVIKVPSLLFVAADTTALGRAEASPAAVREWSDR